MEAYKTNIMMWRWFLVSSMKAAVHVDPKHIEYLEVSLRIQNLMIIESLFDITKRLIMDNLEIRNVRCLDCMSLSWTRSTLRVTTDH